MNVAGARPIARLHVDQRRRLARALNFNRLAFALCSLGAVFSAEHGRVVPAFVQLGCVVVIGFTMARIVETEWMDAILRYERIRDTSVGQSSA